MALGKRVKLRREQLGLTQKELGKLVGRSISYIQSLENRDSRKTQNVNLLADALKTTVLHLETGREVKIHLDAIKLQIPSNCQNSELAHKTINFVPLISWEEVGGLPKIINVTDIGKQFQMIPCIQNRSNDAYALEISGDSMSSSGVDSFPSGTKIIIDPERSADNGDFVIAMINGDDQVVFKQLIIDGSRQYLKSLNSQYPIITEQFTVLGRLISSIKDY